MNMRSPGKKWLFGIALVLVALSIGAAKKAAPPEKLTVAAVSVPLGTPVWVAEAEGFYREEGLEVTLHSFELGKEALDAMLAGEADVATVAATPIVLASFTRRDFVVFANMSYADNDCKIVARRDRGIEAAADLKGKTVGTPKGTSGQYFLEAFLAHHGLAHDAVAIRDMKPARMADGLRRGEVDAVAVFEPYALETRKRLGDNAVVITAPEVYRETFNLTTRRQFADARPQALVKFLRAIVRAEDFIHTHPAEVQAIMAQRTGMSPTDLASVMPDFTFTLSLRQSLLSLLEDEARWAIRRGLVQGKTVPNYLGLLYPDALEAVSREAVTIIVR